MEIVKCDQLSAEWFQCHVGRCTASHAADITDFLKNGKEGASRRNYRALKVAEILSGIGVQDNFVSQEMQWGIDTEAEARRAYALEEGVFVEQIGFAISDIDRMGASPDGLVGDDGLLEIKCPKTATHIKWMLDGVIPDEHMPQCRFQLAVMQDRKWLDFMSYDPRLPKRYRSFTIRLMREDAACEEMDAAVIKFNAEVDAMIAKLNEIAPPVAEEEPAPDPLAEMGISDEEIAWAAAGFPEDEKGTDEA